MMVDVCRLCLSLDDLVWIFDERIAEPGNMRQVINTTVGVEIKSTDTVTQKVCKKCCQITIKMFKFRSTAIKNDRALKSKHEELTKAEPAIIPDKGVPKNVCRVTPFPVAPQETKSPSETEIVTGTPSKNTQVEKSDVNLPARIHKKSQEESNAPNVKASPSKKQEIVIEKPHESVIQLSNEHPQLKIPRSCIKSNLLPDVALDSDDVTRWFEARRALENKKQWEAKQTIPVTKKLTLVKNQRIVSDDEDDSDDVIVVDDEPSDRSLIPAKSARKRLHSSDFYPSKRKVPDDAASASSSCNQDAEEIAIYSSVSGRNSRCESVDSELLYSDVNVVTYNNKEMKNYIRKHTVCPFCKRRFRVLEAEIHVEECPLRAIMQNLPTIPLVKIEQEKDVTEKYPEAFVHFQAPLTHTATDVEMAIPVVAADNKNIEVDITLDDDIMYISDDDEPAQVTDPASVPKLAEEIRPEPTKFDSASLQPKIPKIQMFGDEIFNNFNLRGSEIGLMKDLMKLSDKYQHFTKPTNAGNITVEGHNDKIYTLKNIVPYLRKYRIPVEIDHCGKLTVRYEDVTPAPPVPRDMWDPKTASTQRSILPMHLVASQQEINNIRNDTQKPSVRRVMAQNKTSNTPNVSPPRSSPNSNPSQFIATQPSRSNTVNDSIPRPLPNSNRTTKPVVVHAGRSIAPNVATPTIKEMLEAETLKQILEAQTSRSKPSNALPMSEPVTVQTLTNRVNHAPRVTKNMEQMIRNNMNTMQSTLVTQRNMMVSQAAPVKQNNVMAMQVPVMTQNNMATVQATPASLQMTKVYSRKNPMAQQANHVRKVLPVTGRSATQNNSMVQMSQNSVITSNQNNTVHHMPTMQATQVQNRGQENQIVLNSMVAQVLNNPHSTNTNNTSSPTSVGISNIRTASGTSNVHNPTVYRNVSNHSPVVASNAGSIQTPTASFVGTTYASSVANSYVPAGSSFTLMGNSSTSTTSSGLDPCVTRQPPPYPYVYTPIFPNKTANNGMTQPTYVAHSIHNKNPVYTNVNSDNSNKQTLRVKTISEINFSQNKYS